MSSKTAVVTAFKAQPTVDMNDPNTFTHSLYGVDIPNTLHFSRGLFITLGVIISGLFIGRLFFWSYAQVRLWSTVNTDLSPKSQRYWAIPKNPWISGIKKHLLYAPIFRKRHNQEIQISQAVNMGTLPTRLHFIILILYIASNIIYTTLFIDYSNKRMQVIADFRGRTGIMAVVNMVPLFVLSGRNNPLIKMLHISFDTYNLFHRWVGRIVVLESVAHTIAWYMNKMNAMGPIGTIEALKTQPYLLNGAIATIAMVLILIQSPSPVRHAFYEIFLHIHIALAILAVVTIWYHLHLRAIGQIKYVNICIAIWALEKAARFIRIAYRNVSRNGITKIKVEALKGEVSRVTFVMARPWKFKPGQHVYIYLPGVSFWQSHPFSLAWSDEKPAITWESTPMTEKRKTHNRSLTSESGGPTVKTMSLLVHKRTGMTAKLYNMATESPNKTIYLNGLVEGPYGGHHDLHSYGTAILIAGGIGITHQIGYIRDFVEGYHNGTIATRRVTIIWVIREMEQLDWIRQWMFDILPMEGRRDILKFLIFVTKPNMAREIVSPSSTIQLFPGRPLMNVVLPAEMAERVGTVAVSVCGPGTLSDNVRQAVRSQVQTCTIDFFEEAFTW